MSKKNHLRGLDRQLREKSPVIDKILNNFNDDRDDEFSAIESAVYGDDDFDLNDIEDVMNTFEGYIDEDDDDELDDDLEEFDDLEDDDELDDEDFDDDEYENDEVVSKKKKNYRRDEEDSVRINKDHDDDDEECEDYVDESDIELASGFESFVRTAKSDRKAKKKLKKIKAVKDTDDDEDDGLDPDLDEDSDDPDLDYMEGAEEATTFDVSEINLEDVMEAIRLANDDDEDISSAIESATCLDDTFSYIDDDDL